MNPTMNVKLETASTINAAGSEPGIRCPSCTYAVVTAEIPAESPEIEKIQPTG